MKYENQVLRAHRNRYGTIDRFQMIGDRCSGTNYLQSLMRLNFPTLQYTEELGWKHGFLDRRMADRNGLLVLVIYRHPIRWLQSFFNRQHEVRRTLGHLSFSEWIRAEWAPVWNIRSPDGTIKLEPIQADMIPHTSTPHRNILAMRNSKIEWFEELAKLQCQVGYLRYEDLNRDPRGLVSKIADAFELSPARDFTPVSNYKGEAKRSYIPNKFPPVNMDDMNFIRDNIDMDQENHIGYRLDDIPHWDGLSLHDSRVWRAMLRRLITDK
jgi:hypothetical protein